MILIVIVIIIIIIMMMMMMMMIIIIITIIGVLDRRTLVVIMRIMSLVSEESGLAKRIRSLWSAIY